MELHLHLQLQLFLALYLPPRAGSETIIGVFLQPLTPHGLTPCPLSQITAKRLFCLETPFRIATQSRCSNSQFHDPIVLERITYIQQTSQIVSLPHNQSKNGAEGNSRQ